jgi:hypothetical protein
VVTCTEIATEYKELATGAFLDTEGAFDRTSFFYMKYDIIREAAERHHTEPTIYRLICSMLESRT